MTNHSDEAESFADSLNAEMTDMGWMYQFQQVREAYLAGVAAAHAKQHAATREQIARWGYEHADRHVAAIIPWSDVYEPLREQWRIYADALLAPDGPLLDAGEVWEESVTWLADNHAARISHSMEHAIDLLDAANPYREARP